MEKRGGLLVVGIVLILLISGTCVYLYNYHVLKTVRVCVSGGNNMGVFCETSEDCIDIVKQNAGGDFEDAPEFI